MILAGENKVFGKKTFPSATFATTNFTYTGLIPKPGLRGEKLETWQVKDQVNLSFI
jgi:hypothetical protein